MIGFVGLTHLGIIYSNATAAHGFEVLGLAQDEAHAAAFNRGEFTVTEPGLQENFAQHRTRMRFTADPAELRQCELVFVSLDVATDDQNRSHIEPLKALLREVASQLSNSATLVLLSQVPPGFTRQAGEFLKPPGTRRTLIYQVETLVFGNAMERALRPERYIVGCEDPARAFPPLYQQWLEAFNCPVLKMRYESAELCKISINLFLVATVSTANLLAEICERVGADWSEITPALRLDKRIGPYAYLAPGLGIAGGNLERDLVTTQALAAQHGTEAGQVAAWKLNSAYRRDWVLRKVHERVLPTTPRARFALWGLAYKAHTHSIKNSPAISLVQALRPYSITAYDPQANLGGLALANLTRTANPLEACSNADCLLVMTPWPEFREVPPQAIQQVLRGRVVIDPYGALDGASVGAHGFEYHRLGAVPKI